MSGATVSQHREQIEVWVGREALFFSGLFWCLRWLDLDFGPRISERGRGVVADLRLGLRRELDYGFARISSAGCAGNDQRSEE